MYQQMDYLTKDRQFLAMRAIESKLFSTNGLLASLLVKCYLFPKEYKIVLAQDKARAVGVLLIRNRTISVYVDPEYRRKGIARSMLALVIGKYRINPANLISIDPVSKAGCKFYDRFDIPYKHTADEFYKRLGYVKVREG